MQRAPNGVRYAAYGDTAITAPDLARMVQAVPVTIAGALARKAYYFVPLAMSSPTRRSTSRVRIETTSTPRPP